MLELLWITWNAIRLIENLLLCYSGLMPNVAAVKCVKKSKLICIKIYLYLQEKKTKKKQTLTQINSPNEKRKNQSKSCAIPHCFTVRLSMCRLNWFRHTRKAEKRNLEKKKNFQIHSFMLLLLLLSLAAWAYPFLYPNSNA